MNTKIFYAYSVEENEHDERPRFVPVGRAFVNRDGSINLALEKWPERGRVHLRHEQLNLDGSFHLTTENQK